MDFDLTTHALEQIAHRRIPRDWLELTLAEPGQSWMEASGYEVRQRQFRDAADKLYLVRAILAVNYRPPRVVTAYRTRQISKYWRTP